MSWLPEKRSSRWLWAAGLIASVQFGVLGLSTYWLLPNAHPKYLALGLLAIVTGCVIGLLGWLGARWFALFTSVGLLLGLILMIKIFAGNGGWEDLVGLMSFMVFLAGGAAMGLLVEIGLLVIHKLRRKRTR